ncbi:hypothetical protein TrVE_jg12610 [Triparma verrucosa]|uniref:MORN repeat-containing protein 5 n=1 Tax=Triparma verrucosa TaxID=1606542 RepID=A0A9W7BMR1_9STRA|nr:hypothetical protein TrVE_jg12610 [Triparma verrucosa]
MEYSTSKYEGGFRDNKMEDEAGMYEYPDGSKYVGSMKDGAFHGAGKLYFDGGVFIGVWKKGKTVKGDYMFGDDLVYKEEKWDYCDGQNDRRFHSEIQENKLNRASGGVYRNKPAAKPLKDGCYDAGDGYFKLKDGKVYSYEDDKVVLREAMEEEKKFLVDKASTTFNTAMGNEPEDDEDEDGGYDF